MAYDIEEQESLATFKAWLETNGRWLTGLAVLLIAVSVGTMGWRWYQKKETAAASSIYDAFDKALNAKDTANAKAEAVQLQNEHGATAYAAFAALRLARASLDAGDRTLGKEELHWIIDKSGNRELAVLARVHLAGVLLDEKAYDEGLKTLPSDAPEALSAAVSDRRGDLLMAQGKLAEARSAYAKALEQAHAQDPLRGLIQTKLDALPAAG